MSVAEAVAAVRVRLCFGPRATFNAPLLPVFDNLLLGLGYAADPVRAVHESDLPQYAKQDVWRLMTPVTI